MSKLRIIDEAVKLASNFFESIHVCETRESIEERATEWYNKTKINDERTIAALAVFGSYNFEIANNEKLIENIKECFFPSV